MSIANENIFNKFPTFLNGNAQAALGESMMSQTNTIAILGYDASTCSTID